MIFDKDYSNVNFSPLPSLDSFQSGLDMAGLFPGLGEPIDGINGLISAARGNYADAGLSFGAMIPVVGWGATSTKFSLKYGDETLEVAQDSVGVLRAGGKKDSHHIIQDAAVRDIPSYNSSAAPGIELPGPSTARGTPHYKATRVRGQSGGGTYASERRIGYKALRSAGFSKRDARILIGRADEYFATLGVGPTTATRIPGNR